MTYNFGIKGGDFVKKPYVPKKILSIQLPVDLHEKLCELAMHWHTTKTGAVVRLLTDCTEEVKEIE